MGSVVEFTLYFAIKEFSILLHEPFFSNLYPGLQLDHFLFPLFSLHVKHLSSFPNSHFEVHDIIIPSIIKGS